MNKLATTITLATSALAWWDGHVEGDPDEGESYTIEDTVIAKADSGRYQVDIAYGYEGNKWLGDFVYIYFEMHGAEIPDGATVSFVA